jgi:multidrug efflux pump subunit AcrB
LGAIMAVGVASANSILLVTFARKQQLAGMSAFDAAISAGCTRIRPVLMTSLAQNFDYARCQRSDHGAADPDQLV